MSEALGLGLVLGMLGMIAMRTIGPIKAVPKALKRAGLSLDDIDLVLAALAQNRHLLA